MTSPVTETLKPCPFCGATPHRGRTKLQRDQLHGHLIFNYRIWCPHDCASKKAPSEELAITAWNARTSDHAQTPQVRQQETHWVVKMSWRDGDVPMSCQMDETGTLEGAKEKVRQSAASFGWKSGMGAIFEIGSYDWPHYVTAAPTALADTSTVRNSDQLKTGKEVTK